MNKDKLSTGEKNLTNKERDGQTKKKKQTGRQTILSIIDQIYRQKRKNICNMTTKLFFNLQDGKGF